MKKMKNPAWLVLLLLVAAIPGYSQQVNGLEYFWDTDPGLGNGTFIEEDTPAADVVTSFDINTTGLLAGLHRLYVREMDDAGRFGITKRRDIYISRIVVTAEYFWDADPGEGNGIPVAASMTGAQLDGCDQVSTYGLSAGSHNLFVRVKSEDGVWSIPSGQPITIVLSSVNSGCAGDYDKNGSINTSDLLSLLAGYGSSGECTYDLSGDFTVNTTDMLLFLGAFGTDCP